MNQRLLTHFDAVLNEKYFGFCFVPGTVNFDEVYAALDHFRSEVDKLKVLEEERVEKAKKDLEESAAPCNAPEEPVAVEAELVS